MNGTKWKIVYQSENFEIQKRMSRNEIENKQIEANDVVKFIVSVDGIGYAFDVNKDVLLKAICTPILYKPRGKSND